MIEVEVEEEFEAEADAVATNVSAMASVPNTFRRGSDTLGGSGALPVAFPPAGGVLLVSSVESLKACSHSLFLMYMDDKACTFVATLSFAMSLFAKSYASCRLPLPSNSNTAPSHTLIFSLSSILHEKRAGTGRWVGREVERVVKVLRALVRNGRREGRADL